MEAGRAIAAGFVTPDRTLMIASTCRFYLVVEKIAMGDGRYDSARLIKAIEEHAQAHLLVDMEALAKQSGAMINAVMLGAHRRLRPPADPAGRVRGRDPRRRQGGRQQSPRLPRRPRGRAAGRTPHARRGSSGQARSAASPRSPSSNARSRRPCRRPRATSSSKACAGSSPIRTSPMRGSISTGSRRSATPTSARRPAAGCCARSRGIWRCACPTRT